MHKLKWIQNCKRPVSGVLEGCSSRIVVLVGSFRVDDRIELLLQLLEMLNDESHQTKVHVREDAIGGNPAEFRVVRSCLPEGVEIHLVPAAEVAEFRDIVSDAPPADVLINLCAEDEAMTAYGLGLPAAQRIVLREGSMEASALADPELEWKRVKAAELHTYYDKELWWGPGGSLGLVTTRIAAEVQRSLNLSVSNQWHRLQLLNSTNE